MWNEEFKKYQAGLALKVRYLSSEVNLSQEKLAALKISLGLIMGFMYLPNES